MLFICYCVVDEICNNCCLYAKTYTCTGNCIIKYACSIDILY